MLRGLRVKKALYGFEGAVHFQKERARNAEKRGGVAQLGERLPCKQEAIGSNPFISTKEGLIAQLVRARA